MAQKYLVIFDFDWSLINENSDTYVIEQLTPSLMDHLRSVYKSEEFGPRQWTKLMAYMVHKMMTEYDVTPEKLSKCLRNIPIFRENLELLSLLVTRPDVEIRIISDANTFYISEILDELQLTPFISCVVTNPAVLVKQLDEVEVLEISPYHCSEKGTAHSCMRCNPNLCKGSVLNNWRRELELAGREGTRMLYVGDGSGDICACLELLTQNETSTNPHIVCCRKDWSLHKGLLNAQANDSALPSILDNLRPWTDGKELYDHCVAFLS